MPSKTNNKNKDKQIITMPVTKNGVVDKRYVDPQRIKTDGTRDKRCKLTSNIS
jgi:hypothetical protein